MAAVRMENRLPESEPSANSITTASSEKGQLLPNLSSKPKSSSTKSNSRSDGKSKRGKLSKALTLPAEACSPPISNEFQSPRPVQILPRTSQYEKNPLLQERSASGLCELEAFLSELEPPSKHKTQAHGTNTSSTKLKLEPRGAECERHDLLKKTSSGKSELEQFLLEKEKELVKKEKKSQEPKGILGKTPLKKLLVKRGVAVEKAKSFEKSACLEKGKTIDQSQNVSRARSLEEESSLEKVKPKEQATIQQKSNMNNQHQNSVSSSISPGDRNANSGCSSTVGKQLNNNCGDLNSNIETNSDDNTLTNQQLEIRNMKKQRLLDLALKPNLEWREDDQQFVVVLQSPTSPLAEKPDNLLICYENRTNSVYDGCGEGTSSLAGVAELRKMPAFEKPKKSFHPTVIDSDPDSEGMVCCDELESIDFAMSSPESTPRKCSAVDNNAAETDEEQQQVKTVNDRDDGATDAEKDGSSTKGSTVQEDQETDNQREPQKLASPEKDNDNTGPKCASQKVLEEFDKHVDVLSDIELRRKISLKRASLGQLEPRTEQYVQHPLLEEKDEEGQSAITKLLREKDREMRERETLELQALAAAEKEAGDLATRMETKHAPKASIKRVHFEKSDPHHGGGGGSEIEELGKVDIEADLASTSSNKSNGSKKKGFRGSKNNKTKSSGGGGDAAEEEKLLDGEGEDNEVAVKNSRDESKKKCCCIS